MAKQSSERERKADEAERETIKLKKVEYMSQHLWEVYEGVISGVTAWGIYVELPNTVEGLVRAASLQGIILSIMKMSMPWSEPIPEKLTN